MLGVRGRSTIGKRRGGVGGTEEQMGRVLKEVGII